MSDDIDELLARLNVDSVLDHPDPVTAMNEAAETIRTLRAALAGRDATIAAIQKLHRAKHGANDRGPYVICEYDKTDWPCRSQNILAASPADALAADRARVWEEGNGAAYRRMLDPDGYNHSLGADENPYTVKKAQADD